MAVEIKPKNWVLDKNIPITLVIMLIGQVVGFTWYAAKQDSRLADVEKIVSYHQTLAEKRGEWIAATDKRLERIDTNLENTSETIKEVKALILARIAGSQAKR